MGDTAEEQSRRRRTADSEGRRTVEEARGGGPRWRRPAADAARQRRLQGQARGGGVAVAEGRTQQFRGEMRENSGLEAHRLAASFD